jgi:hypothetical protein
MGVVGNVLVHRHHGWVALVNQTLKSCSSFALLIAGGSGQSLLLSLHTFDADHS